MSEKKVNHKELLTFSNLTNLEWEFVDLKAIKEGEGSVGGKEVSDSASPIQLNDLLTPEAFAIRDEEGEIKRHIYGEDDSGNYVEQQGLIEMRKQAGVAMEYLEHSDDGEEGEFLKDWEVIYGGDKYQILKEYLDQRFEPIRKIVKKCLKENDIDSEDREVANDFLTNDPYPARENLEGKSTVEFKIKAYAKRFGISVLSNMSNINGSSGQINILEELANRIYNKLKGAVKKEALKYVKKSNINLYLALKLWDTQGDIGPVNDLTKEYKSLVENDKKFKELEEMLEKEGLEGITINEKVDLYDEERYKDGTNTEEFRVLVLKKEIKDEDHIVIAHKGKKLGKKKVLPDEFQGLQLVYKQMAAKYPEAKITFTGCKGGADLGFINLLFSNQRRNYTVQDGDTVIDVGKEIIGDDWKGKLRKKSGNLYTRDDDLIYPEENIYYDPLDANLINGTLFYGNISNMKELLSFTKYNLDSNYKPWIKLSIEGIKGTMTRAIIALIQRFIYIVLAKFVINIILSSKFLLMGIALTINVVSCLTATTAVTITPAIIESCLTVQGAGVIAAGTATTLAIIGFVASLFVLGIYIGIRGIKNQRIKDIYDTLDELELIQNEAHNGEIKGYIIDEVLQKEAIEIEAVRQVGTKEKNKKSKEKVKIAIEYAIYIKDKGLEEYAPFVLRKDSSGKDSLYIAFDGRGKTDFLKFIKSKDDDIYELKSFIENDESIGWNLPPEDEIKTAGDDYEAYMFNTNVPYEWIVEPEVGLKKRILELREKGGSWDGRITKEERMELNFLTVKRVVLLSIEEEIGFYKSLISILQLFGGMQRVYEKSGEILEVIYPDISKYKKGIKIAKGLPQNIDQVELNEKAVNEFLFMPYLDEEGYIGDKLRDEYLASVFKSVLAYKKIVYPSLYESFENLKYGTEKLKRIKHNFGEKRMNEEFRSIMSYYDQPGEVFGNNFKAAPHYYKHILKRLSDSKGQKLIDEFYEVGNIEDMEVNFNFSRWKNLLRDNDDIKGEVIINPNWESSLEYKYNPEDIIVGGELRLIALDLSDELKGIDRIKDTEYSEYKPNYTIIYGSADEENPPEGEHKDLEFWCGTHHCYEYIKHPKEHLSKAKQLLSNPEAEVFIEGQKIGQNLERELEWESYIDHCQDQQKYRETIELEDDMILDLKYTYDLNGGFISLFKKTRFAYLKIEYRSIAKEDKDREFKDYDTLLIKEFDVYNQDYGITIPDQVVVKAGFHSQQEASQEPEQDQIDVEEHNQNRAENREGKLLIEGKPVTSLGLDENESEFEEYIICKVKSPDNYLANLAHEWLGSPLRWEELEKEPGTCFTEGEQHTLKKGTKIYIPKEKVRKYKKKCKHCRWSLVEKVVDYIYGEMMTNLESQEFEFIKDKLDLLEQEKTWRDVLDWSNDFKEVGKGYYKWYELVKSKGNWDHKEYILENYSDWSCDLLKQDMYQYNIWSNIHYGYLGLAVGFKEWELLKGAGLARAKQGFDNVSEEYWKNCFQKIIKGDFLPDFDDSREQTSIKIGFELWKDHSENLKKEHLITAIRNKDEEQWSKKLCSRG